MNKQIQLVENELPMNNVTPIKYSVGEEQIAVLAKEYAGLKVTNSKELDVVIRSLTAVVKLRTTIEAERVKLKADSLEYGKNVDKEAKRITALIESVENPLKAARKSYEDEQERIRIEAAEKEQNRIETIKKRITDINNYPLSLVGKDAGEISIVVRHCEECFTNDSFDYQEFEPEVIIAKRDALQKMREIEQERITFERDKASEALKRKQDEDDHLKFEAERLKFEDEKAEFLKQQKQHGYALIQEEGVQALQEHLVDEKEKDQASEKSQQRNDSIDHTLETLESLIAEAIKAADLIIDYIPKDHFPRARNRLTECLKTSQSVIKNARGQYE